MLTLLTLVASARLLMATLEAAWHSAEDGDAGSLVLSLGASAALTAVVVTVVAVPALWLSLYGHVMSSYSGGMH